ncbi:MAG: iron-sulfur cluster-binding domain-containing protein [Rhodoferax sp.]|nr:iron-sulfur cluster-binding domain-containing protein [Rhodoferax sp.]MCB2039368.1 iron-sulfur cluster-binding domain-containing protein [Rhodoferax sp.]MCP5263937.1 iron-sulfur cluster-binding domain-containing protein [Rhodoferax sp.]
MCTGPRRAANWCGRIRCAMRRATSAATASPCCARAARAARLDMAAALRQAPAGRHLYACGPQRFIDPALETARAQGWSQQRLHCEYFSAAPADTTADGAFELEIASTARVIPVRADQSTQQALQEAGLDVPSSCEQGVCGTCLTGVKAGMPLHRDHTLTPEEQQANDQFLPCCPRARSARPVLDL